MLTNCCLSPLSLPEKARYRNRRVVHFFDGSVAGETGWRMKAFPSFDGYRAFVDRR